MTIRDPEVLEHCANEPELLAIADAVEDTQRLPRSSRRRVLARSAVTVAIAAAALIAALLWPGGGRGHRSPRPCPRGDRRRTGATHVVLRRPSGFQVVELRGGRTISPTDELETWNDRSLRRWHAIVRERGQVISETLIPAGRRMASAQADPASAALWSGYRQALAEGTAKLIGKGSTLWAHDVYWLQFPLPDARGHRAAGLPFDQDSYRPVAIYGYTGGSGFIHQRVLLARTEPFSDSDFRRNKPRPVRSLQSGTARVSRSCEAPVPAGKAMANGRPSIQGDSLTEALVRASTAGGRPGKRTTHGVELRLRILQRTRRCLNGLRIDEMKRRDATRNGEGIPNGYMKITPFGYEHLFSAGRATKALWTGKLVVEQAIYMTITSDLSRDAVLAVARALKPV